MEKSLLTNRDRVQRQRYDLGIGSGFVAFTAYRWASAIVQEWGQKPSQHLGIVLGITVCFAIVLFLFDFVLWRWQFAKAIRSGLWASAALGPYVALVAWTELAHPVWSHVIGLISTVLVFVGAYYLDKKLQGTQSEISSTQ